MLACDGRPTVCHIASCGDSGMRVVRLSVFLVLLAIPVTAQDMPLPPHSAPCQYGQASVDTLGEWRIEEHASRCYNDL